MWLLELVNKLVDTTLKWVGATVCTVIASFDNSCTEYIRKIMQK